MGRLATAVIVVLAAAPLASGCFSFAWRHETRNTPPASGSFDELRPGEASLAQCLERLGAPLYVWEYKGNGVALAYGWLESDEKGFALSVPVAQDLSASASYDDRDTRMRGVVLLFAPDLTLELVKQGNLSELSIAFERRRPAPAEPPTPEDAP